MWISDTSYHTYNDIIWYIIWWQSVIHHTAPMCLSAVSDSWSGGKLFNWYSHRPLLQTYAMLGNCIKLAIYAMLWNCIKLSIYSMICTRQTFNLCHARQLHQTFNLCYALQFHQTWNDLGNRPNTCCYIDLVITTLIYVAGLMFYYNM